METRVKWPETLYERVLRARIAIDDLFEKAISSEVEMDVSTSMQGLRVTATDSVLPVDASQSTDTLGPAIFKDIKQHSAAILNAAENPSVGETVCAAVSGVQVEVLKVVQALADSLPMFEQFEDDDDTSAKTGAKRSVDELEDLRNKVKLLQARSLNFRSKCHELEARNDALKAHCIRKDDAIDYIRQTLFQEVTQLREQLHRQNRDPSYFSDFGSLFDYTKLMEGFEPRQTPAHEALRELRKEQALELIKLQSKFQTALRVKDTEIADLRSRLDEKIDAESNLVREPSLLDDYGGDIEGVAQQFRMLRTDVQLRDGEIEQLKKQLEEMNQEVAAKHDVIRGLKDQLQRVNDEIEDIVEVKNREIVSKVQLVADLEAKLALQEGIKNQLQVANTKNEKLSIEVVELRARVSDLEKALPAVEAERNSLKEANRRLEATVQKLESLGAEQNIIAQRAMSSNMAKLEDRLNQSELRVRELDNALSDANEELMTTTQQLKNASLDAQKYRGLYEKLTGEHEGVATEFNNVSMIAEDRKRAIDSLQERLKEKNDVIADLQLHHRVTQDELAVANAKLKADGGDTSGVADELNAALTKCRQLEAKVDELRRVARLAVSNADELQDQLESMSFGPTSPISAETDPGVKTYMYKERPPSAGKSRAMGTAGESADALQGSMRGRKSVDIDGSIRRSPSLVGDESDDIIPKNVDNTELRKRLASVAREKAESDAKVAALEAKIEQLRSVDGSPLKRKQSIRGHRSSLSAPRHRNSISGRATGEDSLITEVDHLRRMQALQSRLGEKINDLELANASLEQSVAEKDASIAAGESKLIDMQELLAASQLDAVTAKKAASDARAEAHRLSVTSAGDQSEATAEVSEEQPDASGRGTPESAADGAVSEDGEAGASAVAKPPSEAKAPAEASNATETIEVGVQAAPQSGEAHFAVIRTRSVATCKFSGAGHTRMADAARSAAMLLNPLTITARQDRRSMSLTCSFGSVSDALSWASAAMCIGVEEQQQEEGGENRSVPAAGITFGPCAVEENMVYGPVPSRSVALSDAANPISILMSAEAQRQLMLERGRGVAVPTPDGLRLPESDPVEIAGLLRCGTDSSPEISVHAFSWFPSKEGAEPVAPMPDPQKTVVWDPLPTLSASAAMQRDHYELVNLRRRKPTVVEYDTDGGEESLGGEESEDGSVMTEPDRRGPFDDIFSDDDTKSKSIVMEQTLNPSAVAAASMSESHEHGGPTMVVTSGVHRRPSRSGSKVIERRRMSSAERRKSMGKSQDPLIPFEPVPEVDTRNRFVQCNILTTKEGRVVSQSHPNGSGTSSPMEASMSASTRSVREWVTNLRHDKNQHHVAVQATPLSSEIACQTEVTTDPSSLFAQVPSHVHRSSLGSPIQMMHEQLLELDHAPATMLRRGFNSHRRLVHDNQSPRGHEKEPSFFVGEGTERPQSAMAHHQQGGRPQKRAASATGSRPATATSQSRVVERLVEAKAAGDAQADAREDVPSLVEGLADRSKVQLTMQNDSTKLVLESAANWTRLPAPHRVRKEETPKPLRTMQDTSSFVDDGLGDAPGELIGPRHDAHPDDPSSNTPAAAVPPHIVVPVTVDNRAHVTDVFLGGGRGAATRGVKEKIQKSVNVSQFMNLYGGSEAFVGEKTNVSPNSQPFIDSRPKRKLPSRAK